MPLNLDDILRRPAQKLGFEPWVRDLFVQGFTVLGDLLDPCNLGFTTLLLATTSSTAFAV